VNVPEPTAAHTVLGPQVFLVLTYDLNNQPCHGTGFFVSPEYAFTAYHNLSPSVRDDPSVLIDALHEGQAIEFEWALPDKHDRDWQELYDIAVLKLKAPKPRAPTVRGGFLSSRRTGAEREHQWARRTITVLGYPQQDGLRPIGGTIAADGTIAEAQIWHGNKPIATIPNALSINLNREGLPANLGGLSGAPVFDPSLDRIVGVVIAADQQLKVTELVHVVERWPEARTFLEELSLLAPRPYRMETRSPRGPVMVLAAVCGLAALGWGLWYGVRWVRTPKELVVALVRGSNGTKQKPPEDGTLAEGEKVRISITSPATGYLYIVDQEITKDGKYREPTLLFPNEFTPKERTQVSAGSVVNFPDPKDNPSTIEPTPLGTDYAGELLTVMVFDAPLPIQLTGVATAVTVKQIPQIEVTAPNPEGNPRRLVLSAQTPPLAVKKIKLAVRASTPGPTTPALK